MSSISAERGPGRRARVLVVEDEADLRESLADSLEANGYRAITAADGREGLRRLRACEADCVVLDLAMPVMDGWQFRYEQQRDPSIAKIPVVAISAVQNTDAKIDADCYLRKPFASEQMLAAIDSLVARTEPSHVERMIALGTVASSLAHEVNNPLTYVLLNITGAMQVIAQTDRSDERTRDALDLAERMLRDALDGSERIRGVVDGIRLFSRAERGPTSPVDVHRCLDAALKVVMADLRARARLTFEPGPLPFVLAHEGRLGQVFLNLLTNAVQAIEEGAPDRNEIRVVTRTDATGRAVVEIVDTGTGIPAHLLARVFDSYFTTKPAGKGTGLGLSISQGIVHALGGEITAESEVGRGTTFRVSLLPAA